MTEEDEAFNEIERQAKQRKESVMAQLTPLACERCKQLEEQAYDLLGRLQAANLSMAMLRQADQFKQAAQLKEYERGYEDGAVAGVLKQTQSDVTRIMNGAIRNDTINEVLQIIKELRPAILPLEGMGRGKATQEWLDILVKDIEEMKK